VKRLLDWFELARQIDVNVSIYTRADIPHYQLFLILTIIMSVTCKPCT